MDIFRRLMREDDDWNKVIHSEEYNKGFEEGYCKGKKDAVPKWTPVSEVLPEENKEVLVTAVFSNGEKEVGRLSLVKGKWTNDFFNYDVIAWMPLPEPFKEEENE